MIKMKKYVPVISIALFPYAVVFALYCIFSGFLMENVFQNNGYLCLLALLLFWCAALICTVAVSVAAMVQKWDHVELCRVNMLIKLIMIPAYIVIFIIGVICILTIFTIAFSVILVILDVMSMILSGIFGVSAIKRSYDSGAVSALEMIIHVVLQFVFCADIVSSVIVYHKAKRLYK